MHFPASAQPMINMPMVYPGAPNVQTGQPMVQTGAPGQLGCGVVGVGCGDAGNLYGSQLALGDAVTVDTGWPLWLKLGLGVGALGIVAWLVTVSTHREPYIPMRHY